MSVNREGYEIYLTKCMDYGLEPINFYHFVRKLSKEQLEKLNEQAKRMKGLVSNG